MHTETERLLAGLRRIKRHIERAELALKSERAYEKQIERRREARLKYVVGGDVVSGAQRDESDAMTALSNAHTRARERDKTLFTGRVPEAAEERPSHDEAPSAAGSG